MKKIFPALILMLAMGMLIFPHFAHADITSNLVGWWRFDEGAGTTAADSSGNSNTGTLQDGSNSSWTTKAVVGIRAYYDVFGTGGGGGYVDTANTVAGSHQDQTYAAWIYPKDLTGQSGINIIMSTEDGFMDVDSSGHLNFNDRTNTDHTYTGTAIPLNKWTHVAVTCADATGQVTLYINGVQVSQDTSNGVACFNNLSSNIRFGTYHSSLGNFGWTGYIDDGRYYQRVLSSSDVTSLFQTANVWKTSLSQDVITPSGDLMGWWTMDGTDTNWRTGLVTDRSGGGNPLSLASLSTTSSPVIGKFGQALKFNGVSQYMKIPSSIFSYPSTSLTFSAWFKTTSHGVILGQDDTAEPPIGSTGSSVPALYVGTDGKVYASMFWHGSVGDQAVSTNAYNDGKWHQIADTFDLPTGAERLYIDGSQVAQQLNMSQLNYGSNTYVYFLGTGFTDNATWTNSGGGTGGSWVYFPGSFDDVRVYNRVLSSLEVKKLYSSGIAVTKPLNTAPCVASYANHGGTGDRRPGLGLANILVTSSGGGITAMQGGGGASDSAWVDGDNTSAGHGFFSNVSLDGSQWLEFDFNSGNQVLITEAKYYQQTSDAQGTWKWQGSNDNSIWTDIGGSFTLGGTPTETITTLSSNITKYRYYRINGLSGATTANPWLYEMEFKICGLP